MKKELNEAMEIINYCVSNVQTFPIAYQLQVMIAYIELANRLKPIYECFKDKRENEILNIIKTMFEGCNNDK